MTAMFPTSSSPTSSILVLEVLLDKSLTLTQTYGIITSKTVDAIKSVSLNTTYSVTAETALLINLLVELETIQLLSGITRTVIVDKLITLSTDLGLDTTLLTVLQKLTNVSFVSNISSVKSAVFDKLFELSTNMTLAQDAELVTLILVSLGLAYITQDVYTERQDFIERLDLFMEETFSINLVRQITTDLDLTTQYALLDTINQNLQKEVSINSNMALEVIANTLRTFNVTIDTTYAITTSSGAIVVDLISPCRTVRVVYDNRTQAVKFKERILTVKCK